MRFPYTCSQTGMNTPLRVHRGRLVHPATTRRLRFIFSVPVVVVALFLVVGCSSTPSSYAPLTSERRDTLAAQRLTQDAAAVLDTEPVKAEKLLREALAADLYHGPAHNNLGVVYLKHSPPLLYEAASEFEWARKLMPGHPDPRMNLAFTLESAGRVDDALAGYRSALEVYPDHLPTIQAMARLQVRSGREDAGTPQLLRDVALRSESSIWQEWARLQSIRLSGRSPQGAREHTSP